MRDVLYSIYGLKFRTLQVRENEFSLRKWSGGTAQLPTVEGTLITGAGHVKYCWQVAKQLILS